MSLYKPIVARHMEGEAVAKRKCPTPSIISGLMRYIKCHAFILHKLAKENKYIKYT